MEVGQGLIHLASKGTTFHLLQQFGGLGLDSPLFLVNLMKLETSSLLAFYRSIFFCVDSAENEKAGTDWFFVLMPQGSLAIKRTGGLT